MKFHAAAATLLLGAFARAADSPGDAALTFLRGLSEDNAVFAVGDTAISPEVPAARRADIAGLLGRLGRQIRPDDLRVLEEKRDGELAAVLVSQVTDFDSDSVQVHAVGMVKSDDRWRPAPLPSSFNSTGLSLRPGLFRRAKELENWMLKTRSAQLVRLKDDIFSLLFDEMKKSMSPDELHESTPEKLAGDFLAALEARDLPALLALAGGLDDPRPSDWEETFQALSRILRRKEIRHSGWRLLGAPEAARAVVFSEQSGDDGVVSVVALDPAGDLGKRPRLRAIHLPFFRSKAGLWRVGLPEDLLSPVTRKSSRDIEDDEMMDADIVARFPERLATFLPPLREPTSRAAAEALVAALREPSVRPLCRRLDLSKDPDVGLDALVRSARLWQVFHRPDEIASPVLLEVHESGDDACLLIQAFTAKKPEVAELQTVFLKRGEGGWLANPGFSGASALAHVVDGTAMSRWIGTALRDRDHDWSAGVFPRIGGVPADSAPGEDETRALIGDWRQAIAAGDGARVLGLSACFDDAAGSKRALRNTGYEMMAGRKGEILAIHRAGRWSAVSMRVPPVDGDDSADAFPLFVVVATDAGPRVLPELDLFDPLTRSREFLNRRVWERVDERLPAAARGELESIYEKHRTLSAADRERRPNTTE